MSQVDVDRTAEVLAAEEERCRALWQADWEALANLMHEDLIYVHVTGKVQGKKAYLEEISGRRQRKLERTDLKVTFVGDVALMVGGIAHGDGDNKNADRVVLQVWTPSDGKQSWTLAGYQATMIKGHE